MSPIPPDKRDAYVEAVTDSSRYFAIRVEDPGSGRHAFLGMGFAERGEAFDFNVALSDHVKHCKRQTEIEQMKDSGGGTSTLASEDAQMLYQPHRDLSLKQGQTIHVSVKQGGALGKKPGSASGLFAKPPGGAGFLPPPPAGGIAPPPGNKSSPAFAPATQPQSSKSNQDGWSDFSDASVASSEGGWATFD
eukprot:scaffold40538_cov41-Prasinocladus_malaysianus.AAC.1